MKATITLRINDNFEDEEIECLRDNLTENHPRSIRAEHQLLDLIKGKCDFENTECQVDDIDENPQPVCKTQAEYHKLYPILGMTPLEEMEVKQCQY